MKKSISLFLFFIVSNCVILAQRIELREMEVLVGGGPNMFFGDIGEGGIGPVGFMAARYYIGNDIVARLNFAFAVGIDSDEGTKNFTRGYSFKTPIIESTIQLEYYFYYSDFFGRKDWDGLVLNVPKLGLYVFTGAGTIFANPKPEAENQDHIFEDDYSKISLVVPYGLGMQYRFNKKWAASFEVGRRFILSDYLDGFSPESSDKKDIYYFALISVNYRFIPFSGAR